MMLRLNSSQLKYLSDQCATIGNIFVGSLILTQFTGEDIFEMKHFLISLGITLAFFVAGILLRHKINA